MIHKGLGDSAFYSTACNVAPTFIFPVNNDDGWPPPRWLLGLSKACVRAGDRKCACKAWVLAICGAVTAITKELVRFHYCHLLKRELFTLLSRLVGSRDLWVLVLGRFPTQHKIGIPEFKYVANMHGDETVGREILLHLIDFLVTSYRRDPVITRLLNNTRIHIMPTMNPDGFEATKVPDYLKHWEAGGMENGEDLNRNFPDAFERNNASIQPETRAVMNWIKNETFVLSANLHGGALVASYTFDNVTGSLEGYSRSPDDDVFIHLAKTYSFNHASMYKGTGCDNRQTFPDGITNGYSWYQLEGGMQDYNYVWGQCFEITLELSCCKYPPADQLEKFWRDNKAALIEYIKQVHLGIKGQVTDKNGNPIPNAIVEAQGRPHVCPYRTNEQGEYFLLLLPGTYVINVSFGLIAVIVNKHITQWFVSPLNSTFHTNKKAFLFAPRLLCRGLNPC
uniref:Carboxypeptidase M n=1 Tax=Strigops habroptila TaxID=2489341 RepID=A0A672V589_STRHB